MGRHRQHEVRKSLLGERLHYDRTFLACIPSWVSSPTSRPEIPEQCKGVCSPRSFAKRLSNLDAWLLQGRLDGRLPSFSSHCLYMSPQPGLDGIHPNLLVQAIQLHTLDRNNADHTGSALQYPCTSSFMVAYKRAVPNGNLLPKGLHGQMLVVKSQAPPPGTMPPSSAAFVAFSASFRRSCDGQLEPVSF